MSSNLFTNFEVQSCKLCSYTALYSRALERIHMDWQLFVHWILSLPPSHPSSQPLVSPFCSCILAWIGRKLEQKWGSNTLLWDVSIPGGGSTQCTIAPTPLTAFLKKIPGHLKLCIWHAYLISECFRKWSICVERMVYNSDSWSKTRWSYRCMLVEQGIFPEKVPLSLVLKNQ